MATKNWNKRRSGMKQNMKRKAYVAKKRMAKNVLIMKKKLISSVIASGSASADIYRATDIPEWKQYADLFEQYKLTGIKCQFYPQETVNMTTSSGTNFVIPTITLAQDQTDNDATFTEQDLLARFDAKTYLFNKPVTVYVKIKPSILDTAVPFQPVWKSNSFWLATKHELTDDGYDNTPHFGLKYFIGNGGGSSQQTYFRKVTTYYFALKNPRTGNA